MKKLFCLADNLDSRISLINFLNWTNRLSSLSLFLFPPRIHIWHQIRRSNSKNNHHMNLDIAQAHNQIRLYIFFFGSSIEDTQDGMQTIQHYCIHIHNIFHDVIESGLLNIYFSQGKNLLDSITILSYCILIVAIFHFLWLPYFFMKLSLFSLRFRIDMR